MRLLECKLELHPEKTRIVYCRDDGRRGRYEHEKFDFLGYTFRARRSKNRYGKYFVNFSPAVSNKACKAMRQKMRGWGLPLRSDKDIEDLGHMFYSTINGWINYYGRYYKSALYPVFQHLNRLLIWWAMRKYKKLRGHQRKATHWVGRVAKREQYCFLTGSALVFFLRLDNKSRMSGDVQVRFCESLRVRLPWATRLDLVDAADKPWHVDGR